MNRRLLISCFVALFCFSCEKDNPPQPPADPGKYDNGLLVLNEGLYQQNNASVCYYSFADELVYMQSFSTENNRGLGDTANDFEKYTLDGNEYIIIAVDVSSQVEIVDANSLVSVAQVPLFDGTSAREPRRIEVYGAKAFVCCFDGTVCVIDLVSKSVVNVIAVGANPDGMLKVDDQLYVSNSGGLNYPVYDSTIMVINMNTELVTDTIVTRINASKMIVDSEQEIYLLSQGNYTTVNPAIVCIDLLTNSVIEVIETPVRAMMNIGDWLYYYDEEMKAILRFNMLEESFENSVIINCTGYETFYGMQHDAALGLIYCFDARGYVNSSRVRAYDLSGQLQFEFTAELNAKKIIYND